MHLKYTLANGQEIERDTTKAPARSVETAAQAGFTHIMGNVCQSAVVARVRSAVAGESGKAKDVTREQVQAFKAANQDAVAAWLLEEQNETLKEFDAGTLGLRVSAPRLNPVEAKMRTIAAGEVRTVLKSNNIKVPKGEETISLAGVNKTFADMVASRMQRFGERLRKEAEAAVAAETRKTKKLADEAKGTSADDLGV